MLLQLLFEPLAVLRIVQLSASEYTILNFTWLSRTQWLQNQILSGIFCHFFLLSLFVSAHCFAILVYFVINFLHYAFIGTRQDVLQSWYKAIFHFFSFLVVDLFIWWPNDPYTYDCVIMFIHIVFVWYKIKMPLMVLQPFTVLLPFFV